MRPCYVISVVKVTEKHSMIPYPKCTSAFSIAVVYNPNRTLQATSKNQVNIISFRIAIKQNGNFLFPLLLKPLQQSKSYVTKGKYRNAMSEI